jgi:hypothetical protein
VIPLNYFALDMAAGRSMHPENLQQGSLGAGMGWPFALGALVCLVAFAQLLARRIEIEALRSALEERVAGAPTGLERSS